MTCPKCRGAMTSRLIVVDNGGWWSGERLQPLELDVCGACGGAWFDRGEWTAYLARRVESAPEPPRATPAQRKLRDARLGACPRCSVTLDRRERGGQNVDACASCGGLWLDGGEFPTGPRETWERRLARLTRGV